MKSWQIAAVLAVVSLVSLQVYQHQSQDASEFEQWKAEFGQGFAPAEESFRQMIFQNTLKEINQHNADPTQSYQKGINQFTHLTSKEFEHMFFSNIYSNSPSVAKKQTVQPEMNLGEVDWQSQGKVSAVTDQGICDAGYAFCSSSLIESFYLFDKKNVTLSQQQIIDCSADYTTFGCQGGSRNGTLIYIREKGLNTAASYPYRGTKNNCQKETG